MFMALCRGFHVGHMLGEWTCADACLEIILLERPLRDAHKRRIVELFESSGPRVVTRKQYKDIVAAQRDKKLEFEYILSYVSEERFFAIAPPEARKEIDDLCIDIESGKDFDSAVPEKYSETYRQAVEEIRHLCSSGKLPAFYQKEGAKEARPLLAKWKKNQLSAQDSIKLLDMLFVTGQQLYDCDELPEWKDYMDRYQKYMFGDEDERFRHTYSVMEDYSGIWIDESGYYKGPPKPSEFVTRNTESLLGLINDDNKPKGSIKSVGAKLRDRLDTAEQNIRMFFAVKAVLDAAVEAVELDIPGKAGVLAFPYIRISAFIELYNIRLEYLRQEREPWETSDTRLEKALKMLPRMESEKFNPSPESLKQLKNDVLKDAHGETWLRTKLLSLEYEDGFTFREVWDR